MKETVFFLLLIITVIGVFGSYIHTKLQEPPSRAQSGELKSVRAMQDMIKLARATEDHERARGRLPKSLDELVPEFLERLPKDPWGNDYILNVESGRPAVICRGKGGKGGKDSWDDFASMDIYVYLDN